MVELPADKIKKKKNVKSIPYTCQKETMFNKTWRSATAKELGSVHQSRSAAQKVVLKKHNATLMSHHVIRDFGLHKIIFLQVYFR